jgi:predicted DNA-binding transcriptional regulator AlpA
VIAIAEQVAITKPVADPDWRKRPRKRSGFNSPEGYVRERELANMLGVTARTVRRWEAMREGPPRIKISKQVFYRIEAVHEWLRANEQQPLRRQKRGRR